MPTPSTPSTSGRPAGIGAGMKKIFSALRAKTKARVSPAAGRYGRIPPPESFDNELFSLAGDDDDDDDGNNTNNTNNTNTNTNLNTNQATSPKLEEDDVAVAPVIGVVPPGATYGTLLSNRSYFLLWLGLGLLTAGDWFLEVAALSTISKLSASSLPMGYWLAIKFGSPVLAAPFVGPLADRISRATLMVSVDVICALVVLSFCLLTVIPSLPLLFVLLAVKQSVSSAFHPARTALVTNLVGQANASTASQLDSLASSVVGMFSAALGGVAMQYLGLVPSVLLDSGAYLCSALCTRVAWKLAAVQRPDLIRDHATPTTTSSSSSAVASHFSDLAAGFSYLRAHPDLIWITLIKCTGNVAFGFFDVPVLKQLSGEYASWLGASLTIGLFYCLWGIGSAITPLLFQRYGESDATTPAGALSHRRWLIGTQAVMVGALLGMGASRSLLAAMVFSIPIAATDSLSFILSNTLTVTQCDDAFRGRVLSLAWALRSMAYGVGVCLAGLVLDSVPGAAPGLLYRYTAMVLLVGVTIVRFIYLPWWRRTSSPTVEVEWL